MTAEAETQRITHLTALDDVLARIAALAAPVAPREAALAHAIGRVLAEDVFAERQPAAALALCVTVSRFAPSSPTGCNSSYTPVAMSHAVPVDAGAPMPPAADAVAPRDFVEMRAGEANIIAPVTGGDGVLPAGADAEPDASLSRAGRRLTPAHAAALAALGIERVLVRVQSLHVVRARPEARSHHRGRGRIYVAHAIACGGGALLRDQDSAAELEHVLQNNTADTAIIAIGGTGSGRNDASVSTLARLGRVEVHGIALSPGETSAFGFVGARPVLLLPGRLDAAIAGWLMLGRHLLTRTRGEPRGNTHHARDAGTQDRVPACGLAEVVPVRVRDAQSRAHSLRAMCRSQPSRRPTAGFSCPPAAKDIRPATKS